MRRHERRAVKDRDGLLVDGDVNMLPDELMRDAIAHRVDTRSVGAPIEELHSTLALHPSDRDVMLDATRVAAEKRLEGILGQSRRRHYGHAATLVASCLAVAPRHRQRAASDWIAQLLGAHSRRHAFKAELQAALKSVGPASPRDRR
jgi:hypothetical protein